MASLDLFDDIYLPYELTELINSFKPEPFLKIGHPEGITRKICKKIDAFEINGDYVYLKRTEEYMLRYLDAFIDSPSQYANDGRYLFEISSAVRHMRLENDEAYHFLIGIDETLGYDTYQGDGVFGIKLSDLIKYTSWTFEEIYKLCKKHYAKKKNKISEYSKKEIKEILLSLM